MDVTTFTAILAVIFGAISFMAMIRQWRAKRSYSAYEKAAMGVFILLWLMLLALGVGVPWYFATPGVFVLVFAIYHFHYRRLRRMIRSVK